MLPAEAHCTYRAPLNVETRRRLTLALVITAVVMLVELVGGWLAGSLAERPLSALWQVLPTLVLGLVVALAVSPALNTLALGDDSAAALGVPVGKVRLAGGIAVVLLAGSSVAVAGPLAFIGLAAPHLVRPFLGADHRLLVPGCLLAGPVLLLSADILGRLVIRPSELEVGIVTAFLGAPLLAFLARKVAR